MFPGLAYALVYFLPLNNSALQAPEQQSSPESGRPGTESASSDEEANIYTTFRCKGNGLFVSANTDQPAGSPLVANRPKADDWEMFALSSEQSDGTVALRTRSSGMFVRVDLSSGAQLIADRIVAGRGERFRLVWQSDGTVAIQSVANGKWVGAANSGTNQLAADQNKVGNFEQFYVDGSAANGQFVSADSDVPLSPTPLVANRKTAHLWECFRLVNNEDDSSYSLLSLANQRYVSVSLDSNSQLMARAETPKENLERFTIVGQTDNSSVALLALANGRYVTIGTRDNRLGTVLSASRQVPLAWELFQVRPDQRCVY